MMEHKKKLRDDIVFSASLRNQSLVFHSTWGLFSPEKIDEGTRLLIDHVSVRESDTILDFGCGYGAIGIAMAKLAPSGIVHMVDNNFVAIEYTEKNIEGNGLKNCQVYLSNGLSAVPEIGIDLIVSNLPAKVSKEWFWIFLEDTHRVLRPGGSLVVVTISGLREFIKRNFQDYFGNYEKLKQGRAYTVSIAKKS